MARTKTMTTMRKATKAEVAVEKLPGGIEYRAPADSAVPGWCDSEKCVIARGKFRELTRTITANEARRRDEERARRFGWLP